MQGRESSSRRFAALSALVVAAGCATQPDIVATTKAHARSDAAILTAHEAPTCEEGKYEGFMSAVPDGGLQTSFSATFNFSLVKTLGGEFYVLQDTSTLSGTSDNGSTFTAEITGGRQCAEARAVSVRR